METRFTMRARRGNIISDGASVVGARTAVLINPFLKYQGTGLRVWEPELYS